MTEITTAIVTAFEKQSITEKFDVLSIRKQGELEKQFANEQRDSMEQKDFRRIIYLIVNWNAEKLHGELDWAWEEFLTRTFPTWRDESLDAYAELHDYLNDEQDEKPAPSSTLGHEIVGGLQTLLDEMRSPATLPHGFVDNDHDGHG